MTLTRAHRVDLPCGCDTILQLPVDVDVDVVIADCIDVEHQADDNPSGRRFLVTWRQLVTATVVPLVVPPVELGAGVHVATAEEAPTAPPADHVDGERPVANEPAGLEPGDVRSSPLTEEEWRAEAHRRRFSHALLLKSAREIAERRGLEKPRNLDQIDEVLTPLVMEWLDQNHPAEEKF